MSDTTDVPDATLAKVRALLAKAESTDSEHEREALNERAGLLMAKYGVDRALLAAATPGTDALQDKTIMVGDTWAKLNGMFLGSLANSMRCSAILLQTRLAAGGNTFAVRIFGHGSDIERVETLWTSLLVQQAHGVAAAQVPSWEQPRTYRRGWVIGFQVAAQTRVKEFEERATADAVDQHGAGTEVVLADRTTLAKRALAREYPDARTFRATTRRSRGGADGRAAGERADIGITKVGRNSRALGR